MTKIKNSSSVPQQSKLFLLELYPEWDDFNEIIEKIKKYCNYYSYIIHNKDIDDETGEVKKAHCHLICEFGKKRTIKGVHNLFNSLSLEMRFIDIVTSENSITRYLLHLDDKDKYQYNVFEIVTNNKNRLDINLKESIDKNMQANLLFEYIDKFPNRLTTYNIRSYAYQNNLIEGFNSFYSQLRDFKNEHNALFLLVDSDEYKHKYEIDRKNIYKQNYIIKSLADTFGVGTFIDEDDQKYVIQKVDK